MSLTADQIKKECGDGGKLAGSPLCEMSKKLDDIQKTAQDNFHSSFARNLVSQPPQKMLRPDGKLQITRFFDDEASKKQFLDQCKSGQGNIAVAPEQKPAPGVSIGICIKTP